MKIDGMVVSKGIPDWLDGRVCEIRMLKQNENFEISYDGSPKFLSFCKKKPKLVYPRWWHRLGNRIGWEWLRNFKGLDS